MRSGRRGLTAGLATALLAGRAVAQGTAPPEPADYRMADYRAPVPMTLRGAIVLDTGAAGRIFRTRTDVSWINVLPASPRPENLPQTTLWRPRPQLGVPGSVWLPEVGRGSLPPAVDAWFRAELGHATGGDGTVPVVFYCLSDCWMAWNAARRALSYGHGATLWYRDGLDGWEAAGLPTAELRIAPDAPF